MKAFTKHQGLAVTLLHDNIDTDQILPKQFLTGISRHGLGKHLFNDWRFIDGDKERPNPEFVLNQAKYKGASILVCGANFGCGSSREHAPWALQDFGFKVLIASSFGSIFYQNCLNNGILPIILELQNVMSIQAEIDEGFDELHIDLSAQMLISNMQKFNFDIAAHHKENLLMGLDSIGKTLQLSKKIDDFELLIPKWY